MSKSEVKQLCYMTYNNFGRAYQHMGLIKASIMELFANGATKAEIVILEHKAMSDLKKENEELKKELAEIKVIYEGLCK